ncbi:ABC transporter substrate-binding protein [Paenibacillus allorhizosphaerae]|uniref:Extracellular solute-binding protein n=1 Tax=Paenibacillus allorhizosphaerae TaxID=2849866 RepID=A0ABM8VED8_9BACL|nr:extracellular solute-binding protein [Paenibacillus allorhizosphaerae]CAG7630913.1 hypothetical protein PAECIP111802_01689 [Paenibacillus allorhizosphaerae]
MIKNRLLCLSIIAVAAALAGCSNSDHTGQRSEPAGQAPEGTGTGSARVSGTEPVTLNILASSTELEFEPMLIEPVKKKYPHLTLNIIQKGKGASMKELVAAGQVPDLFTDWTGGMMDLKDLDVFFDISPLIKSQQFDLDRFSPNSLDAIRVNSDGVLYGLPFNLQLFMMVYNKDIFDKFGIPYPKDGMTWTQTVNLAKMLTRLDNGIQYRGLDPDGVQRLGLSLSQIIVNGKTNKADVNNEQWKKVFELGKSMFSIPGNEQTSNPFNDFTKEKRLAMFATYNRLTQFDAPTKEGLHWDIAQYPSFEERPNTYGLSNPWMMFISKQSKYKDQAMQVISVLTSDEVQLINARKSAKLSPLKHPQMKTEFGADVPFLNDKNIAAIFKSQPAPAPAYSEFYSKSTPLLLSSFADYATGKVDVNTALREADEKINKMISEGK